MSYLSDLVALSTKVPRWVRLKNVTRIPSLLEQSWSLISPDKAQYLQQVSNTLPKQSSPTVSPKEDGYPQKISIFPSGVYKCS